MPGHKGKVKTAKKKMMRGGGMPMKKKMMGGGMAFRNPLLYRTKLSYVSFGKCL